jgi:ketosteroid isomerase-like protein
VTVAGDWAIQRYAYQLTLTPKAGGQSMEERGKGIHIFRRQPDGSWLIVQDIWNSDAPPAAPQ